MSRGLIVGKFMPLHRGHQLLIETALAEVDDLTVVVSDMPNVPGSENMSIEKRLGWIRQLYPQLENLVALPDTLPGSHQDHDDKKYAQHYADQVKFLGPFDWVFCSEDYGTDFAQAMGKGDTKPWVGVQIVDVARKLVPVSGTAIRNDPFRYRGLVDPTVYRSLINKVVFVGTESTGKSTLAERMAVEYNTSWVHEYGRELWVDIVNHGDIPTFHDLLRIGQRQYQREEAACLHADKFVFCDTNPWTTLHWSKMLHGAVDARLEALVKRTEDDYIWFFCDDNFDWVDDGTRELKDGKAKQFQTQLFEDLNNRRIRYQFLTGSIDERAQKVREVLDASRNWVKRTEFQPSLTTT